MAASLPWFSSVRKKLHFPRNSRPNLAQYNSERPEVTSYGEKSEKPKQQKDSQDEKSKQSVQTRIHREDTLDLLRRGRGCYGTRR